MIKKIIGYGALTTIILTAPLAYGVYLINDKFKEVDKTFKNIKGDLNSTEKIEANYSISKGLFNSKGYYTIKFNDKEQTEVKIDFNVRHGIEVIFNRPIVITSEIAVSNRNLQTNGPLVNSKIRYYPYYADIEYKLNQFSYKIPNSQNNTTIQSSTVTGNAKYTFNLTDFENYLTIADMDIIENGKTTKYKDFSKQLKLKLNDLSVSSWFFKINEITNPEYKFNNLNFSFVSEVNAQNTATYNFVSSLSSDFYREKLGNSNINAKFSVNALKNEPTNEIVKNFIKLNFNKNDGNEFEKNIAKQILNILSYGLNFDSSISIETDKVGSFNNTFYGKIKNSDQFGVSLKRQLTANGNFTHKGKHVDYLYDLFTKIGFPLVKGKSEIFSVNYSSADGRNVINTNEFKMDYHLPILINVYHQIK